MSIKFVKLKPAETYTHTHTHTHTHTSSLLLSFLSIILISAPAFSYVTNSSHCDNDVLSTYSGSANLTANWQGNPISVTWYNGDTQYDSNQCTYGGDLTMPSSIPQKTGYTFKGWRVRQAASCSFASQVCSLTGSAVNGLTYDGSDSTAYGYYSHDGQDKENESTYGLTAGGWAVKDTSGGIIKGIASCNSTKPNLWDTVMAGMSNGTMTEEQAMNTLWGTCNTDTFRPSNTFNATASGQGNDQYCWCKMESYTPSSGSVCNVASPSWVFFYDYGSASNCAYACAFNCAFGVTGSPGFRRAVFGVAGN